MAKTLLHSLGRYRIAVLFLFLLLALAGVFWVWRGRQKPEQPRGEGQPIPVQSGATPVLPVNPGGTGVLGADLAPKTGKFSPVSIRLSEGQAQPEAAQTIPVATGEPLTAEQISGLLARLPAQPTEPADQSDFRLGQELLPPPRPGGTILSPFPPAPEAARPAPVEAGPLQVLRFAPQGEIPTAPFVSVTFNQPMVALATVGELAAGQSPVQMQPSLPGVWRWLGTQTLTFDTDSAMIDRLPKATEYHLTVPAGTRSATGGVLAEAVEWSFSTPPPKATFTYPGSSEPQPLDPLFFIQFDQRIDPEAVLSGLQVTAGNQPVKVKLAGEAEIQADEKQSWLLKNALEGRWVAFRPVETLPADADIQVVIPPGTPSAEGPLVTQTSQTYGFRTYAPLRIEDHGCAWGMEPCPPLAPFFIRFNNPIDTRVYTDTLLRIDPELPGASVNIFGNTLNIQGASQGRTTYTITVAGDIQDSFGQKLGQEARLDFKVGPAEPALAGPGQTFITLDPASKKPVFSVYAINYQKLDVQIYAVQPSDWPAFQQYLRDFQRTDIKATIPGRLVFDKSIPVESQADTLSEVNIDLGQVMDGSFGQFIVKVEPPRGLFQNDQDRFWRTVQAWVQVTQIGLDAFTDHSEMVMWTTALKDGAPLSDITVSAGPTGRQEVTGEDGTARFPIPGGASYLVASLGSDRAILPRSSYSWGDEVWNARPVSDELRWYVFDDRQMYRPGEEVHVKGWLRRIGGRQDGDVGLVGGDLSAVSYQVMDPQGNNLTAGRAELNALGGFDLVFTVPQETNLGYAQLLLNAEGALSGMDGYQFTHNFQVQEFRRPEFEVVARNETTGPYFAGENAVVAVQASYYAGGPLPNAGVTWQVSSAPGSYTPPNWPDFTFGAWTPWWWSSEPVSYKEMPYGPGGGEPGTQVETFTGQTDANGAHYLRLDFEGGEPRPVSIVAQATVMDVNRQAWTGSTTLLVHPAKLYVGLRSDRYFVERGTPLKVDFIVTDVDGNPVSARPVEVQAARLDWKYREGGWGEVEADIQKCSLASAIDPQTCTFQTPVGGSYKITATVADDQGRLNQSQITRWVSGGQIPPARNVEQEQVTLIPDKETYQPGEVAHILVQSPFSPAEGLLTANRSGILYTQRFQIQEGSTTLDVPIQEQYIPNLNIQVDLTGAASRTGDHGESIPDAPLRPAYASGQLNLSIPPLQRTLSLEATPREGELAPGGETTLDLVLKDARGQPVPDAELAVVVVDEAILALTSYQAEDPIRTFYADRPADLMSLYGRASLVLANPQALLQSAGSGGVADRQALEKNLLSAQAPAAVEAPAAMAMPTMTAEAGAPAPNTPEPIRIRMDFNPLAIFAPSVRTDGNGAAEVAIKLPDNLTRYRVMVVAVDAQGRKFGMGGANLVARLPLMVRPSAPRFLNFGDNFELPIVLQNQTGAPMAVDVAIQADNLDLPGARGLRVTVPARDRLEVRFPAATIKAGTARFQIAVVAEGDASIADAATIELPVYTPATTEAFATYGVIDGGSEGQPAVVAQPVAAPSGVFPQYGGLEITTSSTALQALTDAILYLVSYPFECSEQLASRVLSVAALRDVLTAFQAEGLPSSTEMESAVQRDLNTLQVLQNDDGGFPYWRRGQDSIPFNTIHVAQALQAAHAKGFAVPVEMEARVLVYLQQIENHYPAWYSQNTRWTLSAYALNVRSKMGDRDPAKALRLLDEAGLENLSLDAVGWLWPVLLDAPNASARLEEIRRYVNNRVVETAGAANFTTVYDDQNYLLLGSDRRTDAILLDALISDNPKHDLIPKLVNGLLAHRIRGHWMNTQEDVFILLALDRYFNTYETQTPDFVARVWLGQSYAGSHPFSGRTTDRQETEVPMAYLVDPALGGGVTQDLILSKEGAGRLYYRLGLRYAPSDLHLDPLDMGFVVQRVYEAVDSPEDVSQDADGNWQIKAGARVRVRLTMVARDRRYHVALVDRLPAGLEIVNPALAVSGSVPQDPTSPDYRYGWWWWGTWYEHQNLRDERAEAFASLLWDGVYQYTYIARATTPGTFVAPPAKAEEMYSPEVFGRSGSDIVIVK